MKLSAIDIGSNSVRLLVWADGRSLYKKINTTRLGEGLAQSGELSEAAMRRTAEAVALFYETAKAEGELRFGTTDAGIPAVNVLTETIDLDKNGEVYRE